MTHLHHITDDHTLVEADDTHDVLGEIWRVDGGFSAKVEGRTERRPFPTFEEARVWIESEAG